MEARTPLARGSAAITINQPGSYYLTGDLTVATGDAVQTRKILGYECTCFTVSHRRETFEIWAIPDSTMFPFRLLQRHPGSRRFGPLMIEEEWIGILQTQSPFPLEATFRDETGRERLS